MSLTKTERDLLALDEKGEPTTCRFGASVDLTPIERRALSWWIREWLTGDSHHSHMVRWALRFALANPEAFASFLQSVSHYASAEGMNQVLVVAKGLVANRDYRNAKFTPTLDLRDDKSRLSTPD